MAVSRKSKYQTSMEIMRNIKDGRSSLSDILEDTGYPRKLIKDTVGQLRKAGYLVEIYSEYGTAGEHFEITKKGDKTLKKYLEVEGLLLAHAPEVLEY